MQEQLICYIISAFSQVSICVKNVGMKWYDGLTMINPTDWNGDAGNVISENTLEIIIHSKIPLIILTKIIFCFYAQGTNAKKTTELINERFNPVYTITYATVKKIFADIRSQITDYINIVNLGAKFGGVGKTVEIDESLFTYLTIKFKKHEHKYEIWAVGLIERETKNLKVIVVKNRTKETLTKLIIENVLIGTKIITDNWPSYSGLKEFGYIHEILNKSEVKRAKKLKNELIKSPSECSKESKFEEEKILEREGYSKKFEEEKKINPTTNRIENCWSILKSYSEIYSNCVPAEKAQDFINEFVFRRDIQRNNLNIVNELALII